ncbi:MAG: choice-of-anchor D domain-containing protein, partial [Bacteroidota bacterium]
DYYAIDLDFDFPYYTHVMEKVYVTPMGLLTFDNSVRLVNAPRLKDSYGPIALVSATGGFYKYLTDGKVFYKKESDRLIVQYDHVKEDSWMGHYTFQIVLFDNGNIRFYYNDISTNDPWILNYMTALIEDPEKEDGILASNVMNSLPWQDAMALAFDYPGPQVIADIVNGAGIVMPGQSAEVAIRMNTAGLVEGLTSKNIGIISNDPFNPVSTANIKLNVTSGGIADPVISTTAIDFGRVFQQASKSEIFVIKNDGSSSLNVTGVIMQNGKFNLTGNSPATITPKHAEKYVVTMPTATLGVLNDKVVITFSDGSTHEIVVTGEVVEAPGIDVDLSPIDAALDHGTTDTYPFTIRNDGQAELEVSVTGSEWATTNIAEASIGGSSIPEFTYAWRSSADSDGPVYQWIDIVGKGVKIPAEEMDPFDDEKYWKKVNLPWSFNFFGETYDSLYIGFNGVISFNAGQPATFWSANIPSAEAPNNFIAPWWGSAGYDSYYNPETSGIFYKIEDDKIIISFERLINVFSMGDPMSVQAILYKNGTIKFQYKAQGGLELNSNLGVVGVENKSGTDGVEIAAYQLLPMANGLAYVLSPAKKRYLNPGEQLDGTITLDASNLYAGDYTTALHINSNVPNKETLNKPIHLTVNGSAELATTSEINFGEVMSYEMDYGWYTGPASYTREFALTNEGSAALTVQSMAAENENPELTIQVLVSGFWGPEWINVMDWLWQSQSINPGESVKARVVYSPASAQELANNIVITTDTENVSIPVTATAVLPPAIDADKTPVKVSFNSASETTARTINFNNDNGASALKYELSIDYKRKGATVAQEAQQVTSSTVRLPEQQVSTQKTNSGSIMPLSFNRTLTYEEADAANTFLGFNGTADFTSAVRFNAGSEGFNLTHIQTYFRSESLSAGTLEIEIRAGGTNVATAVSLMTMTKDFTATTPDAVG